LRARRVQRDECRQRALRSQRDQPRRRALPAVADLDETVPATAARRLRAEKPFAWRRLDPAARSRKPPGRFGLLNRPCGCAGPACGRQPAWACPWRLATQSWLQLNRCACGSIPGAPLRAGDGSASWRVLKPSSAKRRPGQRGPAGADCCCSKTGLNGTGENGRLMNSSH